MIYAFGLLVFFLALWAAEQLVSWLEDRPQTRFGRALAALERILGTDD